MQVVDGVLSGGQMGGVWRSNGLARRHSLYKEKRGGWPGVRTLGRKQARSAFSYPQVSRSACYFRVLRKSSAYFDASPRELSNGVSITL